MKNLTLLLVVSILLINCNKESQTTQINSDSIKVNTDTIKSSTSNNMNWQYEEEIDKMGDKIFYAQNICSEDLKLDFPYENSYAKIVIRNISGKNEVIFMVSKGQIKGYIHEGGKTRIKFDEEKPFFINYNGASDGSSEVIFLQNSKKIIDKLKGSKQMVIEIEFYNNGIRQIEFNTEGLNWDH